jgi:hypothetical protein
MPGSRSDLLSMGKDKKFSARNISMNLETYIFSLEKACKFRNHSDPAFNVVNQTNHQLLQIDLKIHGKMESFEMMYNAPIINQKIFYKHRLIYNFYIK